MKTVELPALSLRDYIAYFIPGLIAIIIAAVIRPELALWAEGHLFVAALGIGCIPYVLGLFASALFWDYAMEYLPASFVDPSRSLFRRPEEEAKETVYARAFALLAKHYGKAYVQSLSLGERFYLCWRHVACRTHPDLTYVDERLVTISNNLATLVPIFLLGVLGVLVSLGRSMLNGLPINSPVLGARSDICSSRCFFSWLPSSPFVDSATSGEEWHASLPMSWSSWRHSLPAPEESQENLPAIACHLYGAPPWTTFELKSRTLFLALHFP
jgi:hypothetical protein